MLPNYSVLCSGYGREWFYAEVKPMLLRGVKVFWFGDEYDIQDIRLNNESFYANQLLLLYVYDSDDQIKIIDGEYTSCKEQFESLCANVPDFNSQQYLVEHSRASHIIVTASAGTGKTTVMVDRIMFLLSMGMASPDDIFMITFTNKATDEMARRIQERIKTRYDLTKESRYLTLMEQASGITISTIDSLSLMLLRKIGVNAGYGGQVSVGSSRMQLRDSIVHIIDEYHGRSGEIKSSLGVDLYDAVNSVLQFFDRISSMGLSAKDVSELDWGSSKGGEAKYQGMLRYVLRRLYEDHQQSRVVADKAPLFDITLDVNRSIELLDGRVPECAPKFLFVDEFQDTNAVQIDLVSKISGVWGANLFVVGDSKQSIYRFRGADDNAFTRLRKSLEGYGVDQVCEYELVNNYRTGKKLLGELTRIDRMWVDDGYLDDFREPVACATDPGKRPFVRNTPSWRKALKNDTSVAVNDLRDRISRGEARPDEKIAILVRTNKQVDDVASLFGKDLPVVCKRDRPLFTSDAVRDLYSLIRSFVYSNNPQAMMDYLLSPYATITEPVRLSEIHELDGDRTLLVDLLSNYVDMTNWSYYKSRFEQMPALSVLWEIMEDIPVVDNYVSHLRAEGYNDEAYLEDMAAAYRANLDKVLVILYGQISGDSISLYRMMKFLEVQISTNRDEMEADITPHSMIECMTIHSAKGLEFDTVIFPTTSRIPPKDETEILLSEDEKQVAWRFYKKRGDDIVDIRSRYYDEIKAEDDERSLREFTRLLYVSTTRAKHGLIIYTRPDDGQSPESRLKEALR